MKRLKQASLVTLALAALALAFYLYTQPEFMVQMANEVWACF
jgi:hypothetical protein